MKEFKSAYGTCFLDDKNIFYVNGKEVFKNVGNVIYMNYKKDTHAYIHFKKGIYKIYSLKEKRVLLANFNRIVYAVKNYVIVTFFEENKERFYLHHFIDTTQNRDIISRVNQVILEKDGVTLNHTKLNKPAVILPEKCKKLCIPKEVVEFYAITENNEIFVFAPFPYNKIKEFGASTPVFFKLNKHVKCNDLKELKLDELANLIVFETEEDKKLFVLTCILYKCKPRNEKMYINNIEKVLNDKQVSFKYEKYNVTLTLDKIILEENKVKTEYSYDIYNYNEAYLQNLIAYHKISFIEKMIKEFAINKIFVKEILVDYEFGGNLNLFRQVLYNLNSKPNGKVFYIINIQNRIIAVSRAKFIEGIKDALFEGKKFSDIITRYDLNPIVIKDMIFKLYPEEYLALKKNDLLKLEIK